MRPLSVALTRRGLGESSVRRFRDLLSAFFAKGLVSQRLRLVELRGLEPLTFSFAKAAPGPRHDAGRRGRRCIACMMCLVSDGRGTQGAHANATASMPPTVEMPAEREPWVLQVRQRPRMLAPGRADRLVCNLVGEPPRHRTIGRPYEISGLGFDSLAAHKSPSEAVFRRVGFWFRSW
jgi:hypothetical protein